jgi:pimeloyl-ACP methyl ester carboxylesterase
MAVNMTMFRPSWQSGSTITAPSIRRTSRSTPRRWRFLAARGAAWNGIAPSQPITRLRSSALEYKKQPLEIPVLGLGGDQRFGAHMVPMLEEFAINVTGGSIARCSHYVADERPDEVAAALIDFLKAN